MVQELAGELLAEGIDPSHESVDRMRRLNPGAVSRSVLLRLSRLPKEATALASALSLLGDGTPLFQAGEFAGLPEPQRHEAADALVSARIVEPVSRCGSCTHCSPARSTAISRRRGAERSTHGRRGS